MSILGVYCWGNSCWNIKSIYYGRSDRACVNFGRFHTPGFMSSQSQIIQIIVPWVIGFSRRWDDEWVLSSTGWNVMALHEIVWHFSFQSEKVTCYCIQLCDIILSFQSEAPSGMVWYGTAWNCVILFFPIWSTICAIFHLKLITEMQQKSFQE